MRREISEDFYLKEVNDLAQAGQPSDYVMVMTLLSAFLFFELNMMTTVPTADFEDPNNDVPNLSGVSKIVLVAVINRYETNTPTNIDNKYIENYDTYGDAPNLKLHFSPDRKITTPVAFISHTKEGIKTYLIPTLVNRYRVILSSNFFVISLLTAVMTAFFYASKTRNSITATETQLRFIIFLHTFANNSNTTKIFVQLYYIIFKAGSICCPAFLLLNGKKNGEKQVSLTNQEVNHECNN